MSNFRKTRREVSISKAELNDWLNRNQDYIKRVIDFNNIGTKQDKEDLISEANLYIISRSKYYNPSTGVSIKTYLHKGLISYLKRRCRELHENVSHPNSYYEYYGVVKKTKEEWEAKNNGKSIPVDLIKDKYPALANSQIESIIDEINSVYKKNPVISEELLFQIDTNRDKYMTSDKIDRNLDSKIFINNIILGSRIIRPESRKKVLKYINEIANGNEIHLSKQEYYIVKNALSKIKKVKFDRGKTKATLVYKAEKDCYNKVMGDCLDDRIK